MFLTVGSDPFEAKDIPDDRGNYWYRKWFLPHKFVAFHRQDEFAYYNRPFAANIGVQVLLHLYGKYLGLVVPNIFDGTYQSFLPGSGYKHYLMLNL